MDLDHRQFPIDETCCEFWWHALTPEQRLWLHYHFWDLEAYVGWSSKRLLQDLEDYHGDSIGRYSPQLPLPILNHSIGA